MESSSGRESTGRVPLSGVVRCTVMAMVFPELVRRCVVALFYFVLFVCLFVFVVVVVLDSVYFNETLIGLGLVCFWTKLIYVVRGLISDLCEWRRLCFVGRDNTHVGDIYASKGISRLGNILMHSQKKKKICMQFFRVLFGDLLLSGVLPR